MPAAAAAKKPAAKQTKKAKEEAKRSALDDAEKLINKAQAPCRSDKDSGGSEDGVISLQLAYVELDSPALREMTDKEAEPLLTAALRAAAVPELHRVAARIVKKLCCSTGPAAMLPAVKALPLNEDELKQHKVSHLTVLAVANGLMRIEYDNLTKGQRQALVEVCYDSLFLTPDGCVAARLALSWPCHLESEPIGALLQPLVIGGDAFWAEEDVGKTVGKIVDTPVRSAHAEELWQLARIHLTGMLLQAGTPVQEHLATAVPKPKGYNAISSDQAQILITGLAALITASDSPPTIQVTVAQRSLNAF
eukprot:12064-Heterococcus_DN1.PRE.1